MNSTKPKVFLVEDYNDLREFQRDLLADQGFEVFEAPDGKEALDFLIRQPAYKPNVMVLDLHMPRMDGEELISAIRTYERFRGIPIVLHSSEIQLREVANKLNVEEYLVKPFTPQQFLDAISNALRKRKSKNIRSKA